MSEIPEDRECSCGCGGKPVHAEFLPGHHMRSPARPHTEDRFWAKVNKSAQGCWEWTGSLTFGYGKFWDGNTFIKAHRFAYALLVGPIPDDLVLDHLCRNRACVNPDHLEPVTNRENILRGEGLTAKNAVQSHCVHGHEFTPENTYIRKNGSRMCKTCARSRTREWRRSVREAA